jgi:hypothetical protein
MEEQGFVGNDQEWEIFLIHKALTIIAIFSKYRFMKWIKKNNFEKYEWYYEKEIERRNLKSFWV